MDINSKYIKGRGAQINPNNKFDRYFYDEEAVNQDTQIIEVYPKSILNKVTSPDIGMGYSLNPYQGCEHGCIYCYARNTHNYWGYSAGLEFEQKILIKKAAPQLLEQKLKHPKWKAVPLMFAGNTDCYQPVEQKMEITRSILKVLWKYRHPVGIITKNSLILRDIDILKDLSKENLVHVSVSLTTLNEDLRKLLEPRTTTVKKRLETIEILAKHNIPVNVMMAPIIPGLTEHEILEVAKLVSEKGALSMAYTMVRLNGDVAAIFSDWLKRTMPDRTNKILNKIKACHGGKLEDNRFGIRMRGEGNIAEIINQQFKLAKRKYFENRKMPPYNLDLHEAFKSAQLKLF